MKKEDARVDFVGTYPCFICRKKVRVYGYLPDAVLCAKCRAKVEREESRMVGEE